MLCQPSSRVLTGRPGSASRRLGLALLCALVAGPAGGCGGHRSNGAPSTELVLPRLPGADARVAPPARPAPTPVAPRAGLASCAWVATQLGSPRIRILDLRPAPAFARGHLPGAWSDPDGAALRTDRGDRPAPAATLRRLAHRLQDGGRLVVLVHAGQDLRDYASAARAWLLLHAGGVPESHLAMLQGGYAAWRRQRRPVRTGAPTDRSRLAAPAPARRAAAAPTKTPPAPRAAPGATPTAAGAQVVWTRTERLAAALIRHPWRVVRVVRRAAPPATRPAAPPATRPAAPPVVIRVALQGLFLQPTLQRRRSPGALRARLTAALGSIHDARFVLWSKRGLWSSLLWWTLRVALGRRMDQQVVYYGAAPHPARAQTATAEPARATP